MEQPWGGLRGLERHHPAKYLASIVSRHPHRRNLRGPLIRVENGRAAYIRASVGEVHRPFRVLRKTREEFLPDRDHVVGLSADSGHFPRDEHILGIAIASPKRVKG